METGRSALPIAASCARAETQSAPLAEQNSRKTKPKREFISRHALKIDAMKRTLANLRAWEDVVAVKEGGASMETRVLLVSSVVALANSSAELASSTAELASATFNLPAQSLNWQFQRLNLPAEPLKLPAEPMIRP